MVHSCLQLMQLCMHNHFHMSWSEKILSDIRLTCKDKFYNALQYSFYHIDILITYRLVITYLQNNNENDFCLFNRNDNFLQFVHITEILTEITCNLDLSFNNVNLYSNVINVIFPIIQAGSVFNVFSIRFIAERAIIKILTHW